MSTSSTTALFRAPKQRRLIAVAVASALALGGTVSALYAAQAPAMKHPGVEQSINYGLNFADLVANVQPSVVNISTETDIAPAAGESYGIPYGMPFGGPLERFFGLQPGPRGALPQFRARGLGSGFITDPQGYIVTNNHVIKGASKIVVTLNDGSRHDATLVGHDAKTDLALLEIDAGRELPALAFGDSGKVRPGDWVIAIGNPFGLGESVSAGVVSARGRDINAGPYDDYLQIDAPINRGSSGGPLFNTSGQVIGINTAIFSPSGGNIGIGFAIPSSMVRSVVTQLRDHGVVDRGWLGVQIQSLTPDIADGLGLADAAGALVVSVVPDSPAARADISPGDVILAGNGDNIAEARELSRLVGNLAPEQRLHLKLWRDGSTREITLDVGAMPAPVASGSNDPRDAQAGLGLSLTPLTPKLRSRLGIDEAVHGVLVTGIERGSPAAHTSIRPGDVVSMVGQTPVTELGDVDRGVQAATSADRRAVLLLVHRGTAKQFVAVPLG